MDDARKRCESGGDSRLIADLQNLTAESERFAMADPRRLLALQTLGAAYHLSGRLLEARRHLESAVKTGRIAYGADSMQHAASLIMLAAVYQDLGQSGRGERSLLRAKQILHPHAKVHSTFPARADLLLARMFVSRGRLREAEDLLKSSLAPAPATAEPDLPEKVLLVNLLGVIYIRQERWLEASEAFSRALKLGRAVWGDNNCNSAKAAVNLAMARRRLGRPAEAEELARQAVQTMESRMGSDHPAVGAALIELAEALRGLKRGREAKPLESRARRILNSYAAGNHLGATVDFDVLTVRSK
jgi:tetratricopeptide (TPR) repeat protein